MCILIAAALCEALARTAGTVLPLLLLLPKKADANTCSIPSLYDVFERDREIDYPHPAVTANLVNNTVVTTVEVQKRLPTRCSTSCHNDQSGAPVDAEVIHMLTV
jgi:hypothetical protein